MKKWWKQPKLLGTVAYYAFKSLAVTLRIKVVKDPLIDPHQHYLFAFWHGKQLLPSFSLQNHHHTPMCAMVSPSRDGEILSKYLNKCGFDVTRGSSRANNVASLINLKNKLLAGTSIGFGVDGPIGPIYEVKPGIVYLSQKYNIPIIPMGSVFNSSWIVEKAWDKFAIPKPFSKACLLLDTPFNVPKDMELDAACKLVAQKLKECEQKAQELL